MPSGYMLGYGAHLQAHRIVHFVNVVEFKELNFFVDEILIAFKEFGKENRHGGSLWFVVYSLWLGVVYRLTRLLVYWSMVRES